MINFAGASVVVTGGTGGLGKAVVDALCTAGAVCHIPSSGNRDRGERPPDSNRDIRITGGVELNDPTAVGQYYRLVPQLWGSIHLVGGFATAPIAEISAADFDAQFHLNARTCFLCTRAAVAGIRGRRAPGPDGASGGRIVNIAARPALEPRAGAGMAAYTASKAAVAALTQALSEELAAEQIWVNAVAPSTLDTPVNRTAAPQADFSRWVPLPAIAEVIAFLASPQNRATRGAILPVYGGA